MSSNVRMTFNEKPPLYITQAACALGRSRIAFNKLAQITTQVYENTAIAFVKITNRPEGFLDAAFDAKLLSAVSSLDKGTPFVACIENPEVLTDEDLSDEDQDKYRTINKDGGYTFNQIDSLAYLITGPLVEADEGDAMLMGRIKNLVGKHFSKVPPENITVSRDKALLNAIPVTISTEVAEAKA